MAGSSLRAKNKCVTTDVLAANGANFTIAGLRFHCKKLNQYTNPKGGGLDKIHLNTIQHERDYRALFVPPADIPIDEGSGHQTSPEKKKTPFLRTKTQYQIACHLLGIEKVAYWTGSKGRTTLLGLDIDDHESDKAELVADHCTWALNLFTELTGWKPATCPSGRGIHGFLILDKGWLNAQLTNEMWHGIVRALQAEAERRGLHAKLECKGKARIINETMEYGGVLLKDPFTGMNPTDDEIQLFWNTLEDRKITDLDLKDMLATLANLDLEATSAVSSPSPAETEDSASPSPTKATIYSEPGTWLNSCRKWADQGLEEHDSMPEVVFELSKWLYFIEFFDMDESERVIKVVNVLQQFCLNKHNEFITRINSHKSHEVISHVERIVHSMIRKTTDSAKYCFEGIRTKRSTGQYKDQWFLESSLLSTCLSYPVKFNICCSVSEKKKVGRKTPEEWVYTPDLTPLPDTLEQSIRKSLNAIGAKDKTYGKLVGFLNHLKSKNGEARLSVQSLKKMGFSDHRSRQHIKMLRQNGLLIEKDGSPVARVGKLFVLTATAREQLGMPVFDPD